MSMISEQIDELEMAKHSVLDRDTIDKLLNDAITTIKELSAKVASENMERSDRYYNGGWVSCDDITATYELCADCHSKVRDILNDRNVFKGGGRNETD